MDPQDPVGIHQLMLDTAEQELGIQPVLSSTEMASMAEPDRLGLITYLSQFYEAFKPSPGEGFRGGLSHTEPPPRGRLGAACCQGASPARPLCAASAEVSRKPLSPRGTRGAILFLSKLQKSRTLTHKRAQVSTPLPPSPSWHPTAVPPQLRAPRLCRQESAQKDPEAKKIHRDAEVGPHRAPRGMLQGGATHGGATSADPPTLARS